MISPFFRFTLYIVVFFTGVAGLVYQVVWQKYLSRLMGGDSIATAVILGAFLGGLSLGYLICGKLTTRFRRPFLAYAFLEGIIGIWCLLFPNIFQGVSWLTSGWSFAPQGLIILQGLTCALLLTGIPTICMGGTIPFLTRGFSRDLEVATRVHARVYAVNTAGAFLGALLAGFYLVPAFGLPRTMMNTAFLNLAAAVVFLLFYRITVEIPPARSGPTALADPVEVDLARLRPFLLYGIAFLSGFYVMTLENVLIRIVNLSFGSSSYSFSIIVSVFVLAIALGSFVVGNLGHISGRLLYYNQAAIAVLLLINYPVLDRWPYAAHLLRIAFQPNSSGFWGYYAMAFIGLAAVLILPVGFMGATIPILFHELKRQLPEVGRHSGNLLSWNTLGNLAGSLIGGILLYTFIDNGGVFLFAALLAGLSVLVAGLRVSFRHVLQGSPLMMAVVVIALLPGFFDPSHFVVGTFRLQSPLSFSFAGARVFFDRLNAGKDILFYKDGPSATVAVTRDHEPTPAFGRRSLTLMINGKSDSSTLGDAYTLRLLAHIPALLAERRQRVMVIGLGTGVTAGELTLYPDIEQIDVAEISPAVVRALPLFGDFTHEVHKDPRFKLHIGDAFRILGRSPQKWDIVISEPSNPWVTGVDALFTRDFYRLVKEHLTEDGILMQWFHTIVSSTEMLGMILRTVHEEFPQMRVFLAGSDLLILASNRPVACQDLIRADKTLADNAKVRASLAEIKMKSLSAILVRECWTPSFVADHFRKSDIQTLDFPRLHYLAGRDFFMGQDLSVRYFLDYRTTPYRKEYLFYSQCKKLFISPDTPEAFDQLVKSTVSVTDGRPNPMTDALLMRAYLSDPTKHPLPRGKEREYGIDVLSFILEPVEDEEIWGWINLKNASIRAKAETLLTHVQTFRSWMVPYRMDGLVALLRKGMAQAESAVDKNWCALQLAHLQINEKADDRHVREVLSRTIRDPAGHIILPSGDRHLLQGLEPYGFK
jgi:predicted membrane-bound spermidine synthase